MDQNIFLIPSPAPRTPEEPYFQAQTALADILQSKEMREAFFTKPQPVILLKPNWVLDYNEGGGGMECMVTHADILAAVIQALRAYRPRKIIVGDAPMQSCHWENLVTPALRDKLQAAAGDIPVEFVDFRRRVLPGRTLYTGARETLRPLDRFVLFDLGSDSLLEPISTPPGRFRVTNYDPDLLAETHRPGRHQYLICKEIFEADLVINLPKLKAHKKAGITGALKNLVGINGNKDYLPHHRVGGSAWGGDCYRGAQPLKRLAEFFLDHANRRINQPGYAPLASLSRYILEVHKALGGDPNLDGSWSGNDTVWRTALDLNRILRYGSIDGCMSDTPQRKVLTITDAIIAGQDEGPLSPSPLPMSLVTVGFDPALLEWFHVRLMGWSPENVPLVCQAFKHFRWSVTNHTPEDMQVSVDGRIIAFQEAVEKYGVRAVPPTGWQDALANVQSEKKVIG